jgi:hypothetical protein
MTQYEEEKFLKITNQIITENPSVSTSIELIKMLQKNIEWKSMMQAALEPLHYPELN